MGSSELGTAVGMLSLSDFHFFIYENLEVFQKTEIMGLEEGMDIKKSGYELGEDEK